jgi:transaldolase/glucose-6-phosphate isomerase
MSKNPLLVAQQLGQSIWLDEIRRELIVSGGLRKLIEEDGLRGVTSNPKIFDVAVAETHDYDGLIELLALQDQTPEEIYQAVTVGDVQLAADELRDVYESSNGNHGFVSLEVNPHLAYDTQSTVEDAERLWRLVGRPNVFIKVPATEPGLAAIRTLIARGININVTLLFGLPRYRRVAEAYLAGLEDRLAGGKSISGVRSVASFFLSRIDVLVDPALEDLIRSGGERGLLASQLRGRVAVTSGRLAYQIYREIFSDGRFRELANRGARPQRVLFASTSTKTPDYSDVKYVEALIGPDTINTMPHKTLDAFRDHGRAELLLESELDAAREVLERLPEVGIDLDRVTDQLEREGVDKFNRPYDSMMATITKAREEARKTRVDALDFELATGASAVADRVVELEEMQFCERLKKRDVSLWSDDPEVRRQISGSLGWLGAPAWMTDHLTELIGFARELERDGFRHVVHMGMGGSSLAPLVFQHSFQAGEAGIPLTVLDTTAPETIAAVADRVPLERTVFIVASKSGTTTEPLDFGEYFYERVREFKGERAGENFVAITDPGTPLVELARERGFRRTFLNIDDVGGRYSALTYFGLVPAALLGVDISMLLARAQRMLDGCGRCIPLHENPGVHLGAALGELARRGRDKVTFVTDERVASLGMWLEQLLAESTGKNGRGLLPVVGEALAAPADYGDDRIFVHLRRDGKAASTTALDRLADAGHPVITITMDDAFDLAQEFVRWEVATATAGAVIEINPFDQPDVQSAKDATRKVLASIGATGALPEETPDVEDEGGIRVFEAPGAENLQQALGRFVEQAQPGDYIAILAYVPENDRTQEALQALREELRRRHRVATTVGYGPRYLHSTGQLHKGGPGTGLFLMVTTDAKNDLDVPGRDYSFGTLRLAQAAGDLVALRRRERRVLRAHITGDIAGGLGELRRALQRAPKAS